MLLLFGWLAGLTNHAKLARILFGECLILAGIKKISDCWNILHP
jgi:hypothetical protein